MKFQNVFRRVVERFRLKKLLSLILLLIEINSSGQGAINFSSAATGVSAKFFLPPESQYGNVALRSNHPHRADLFWMPGATTVGVQASELTNQCNFNQAFSSILAQAGYFVGGSKVVPGWISGPIVAQLRIWDTSIPFASLPFYSGQIYYVSPLFIITPTVPPVQSPNLIALGLGVNLTLQTVPAVDPIPTISTNPQNKSVAAGANTSFSGNAYSIYGVSYQWLFNHLPINHATNSSVEITNVGPATVGGYAFIASNNYGAKTSTIANLASYSTLAISSGPTIRIMGAIGYPFRLEYSTTLNNDSNWLELATITMTNTVQDHVDTNALSHTQRFYRGLQTPQQ